MTHTILPPPLEKGDEIRIVSPASAVEKEYIEKTISSLVNLGYKVSLGDHVFAVYHQFAGTDKQRVSDFQEAINDTNVKAIFCARGGYGSVRIVNHIDFEPLRKNPKWLAGFSDITVFHCLLNTRYNITSIHSPMPVNVSSPFFDKNLQQFNQFLSGKFPVSEFAPDALNRPGSGSGEIVGGNLSILQSLQATSFELQTRGKILFIEDVGEQLYHLDRMMNNLYLSGKLKNIKGLILGGFTEMKDKKRPFGRTAFEIIKDRVEEFSYPVAFHFPAGHMENNAPLIFGMKAELKVTDTLCSITYHPR